MYLNTVLPSLSLYSFILHYTTLIRPPGIFGTFATLPKHGSRDLFPRSLRHATLELASTNLICSVALTGVLALQAGRFWAESSDADDADENDQVLDETDTEGTRPLPADPQTEK